MHSLFLMNCYFQSCTFNMLSIGGAVIPSDPVAQLPRLFSISISDRRARPDTAHTPPLRCTTLQRYYRVPRVTPR